MKTLSEIVFALIAIAIATWCFIQVLDLGFWDCWLLATGIALAADAFREKVK